MAWIALQLPPLFPTSSPPQPTPPEAARPLSATPTATSSPAAKASAMPGLPAAVKAANTGQAVEAANTNATCEQLADWALQFNPHVTLVQAKLDAGNGSGHRSAVLIDARSSLRLWGGLPQLLATLAQEGAELGLRQSESTAANTIAHGPSGLAALAALWAGFSCIPQKKLDALPLRYLAAATAHVQTLSQLGCNTWGHLRAMPRGGITRRFGRELLQALDTAYGLQPESYAWREPPEVFCQSCDLLTQVQTAPALVFGAQRLLKLLQAWLRARQLGVIACEFTWQFDLRRDGPTEGTHVLRTAQATQDVGHLQRLLLEHLQRMQLPAPVHHLQLKSLHTEAFAPQALSLLPDQQRKGDALHHFMERVSAKLGPQAIARPALLADHRPERMQKAVHAQTHTQTPAQAKVRQSPPTDPAQTLCPHQAKLLPTWLLREPLKLVVQDNKPVYQGKLQLLQGPQRIETSSLIDTTPKTNTAVARDYFIAWNAHAGLLWIYRTRSDTEWFLHGLYA